MRGRVGADQRERIAETQTALHQHAFTDSPFDLADFGDPKRMQRNGHLRAHLAHCFEKSNPRWIQTDGRDSNF